MCSQADDPAYLSMQEADMTTPQDDREASEIARIAAVLRRESVDYIIHAYSHSIEEQAAALYDAGLRATLARTREPAGEGTR